MMQLCQVKTFMVLELNGGHFIVSAGCIQKGTMFCEVHDNHLVTCNLPLIWFVCIASH